MKHIIRTALILGLFVCHAVAADTAKFVGLWSVDMERTMVESKKSPKYNAKEDEKMPQMLKDRMTQFKIRVSDKEVVFTQGSHEMSLPYTVESGSDTSVILAANTQGKAIKLTFTLIEGKFMNMKSSGTDDMDYYIWKKSE